MSAAALRTVFAELGFNVDLSALEAANKAVDAAVKKARTLVGANAEVDKAEEYLHRRREARKKGWQTRPDPPATTRVGVDKLGRGGTEYAADEWKAHIDRLVKLQELQANASQTYNPFGPKKDAGRGQGSTAFGGKAEAWSKPVTGLLDLVGRFEAKAQSAFGQKLPAAVQTFMGKLGIARADYATMARVAGAATLTVIGVLHRATSAAFDFAAAFTADSEALRETAREARVTSSELQALQHAGAASGVGTERVTRSITAFGQKLRDANNRMAGGSGVSHTLRRLGISMRDASGQVRPTVDLLDEVAVAMEHISSPRRRIRVAESLGLDRRMLDILHTGEGGIRALREEMAELGGGVSPEATEAARRYAQAQERLRVATTSVRSVLFVALAPALQWVIDKTSKLAGWFARMTRGTNVFKIALAALGIAGAAAGASVAAAWIAAAAPFLLAAAAVALLVLAVDDVVTTFQGGDSILGRFLDRLGGVGTRTRFVQEMTEAWEGVKLAVGNAVGEFTAMYNTVSRLVEAHNAVWRRFGEDVAQVFGGAWESVSSSFGRVWDGITRRVQQFFSFVGGGVQEVAQRLGLGDVAAAMGGLAERARAGVEGAAQATGVGGYAPSLGLINDLINPVALVQNAREFYGGMGTGVSQQPIPASRTVSAGGPARGHVVTQTQTLQLAPGAIQVTGVGDPRRAAEMVIEEINRRSRAARDQQAPGARER